MKRYITTLICFLLLLTSMPASAEPADLSAEFARIMQQTPLTADTKFVLVDFDYDGTVNLIAGNKKSVSLYAFSNNSVIKTAEVNNIPIDYFVRMKTAQHTKTGVTDFLGQLSDGTRILTYKLFFTNGKPQISIIATENNDHTGTFQGDSSVSEIVPDSSLLVSEYLSEYVLKPFPMAVLTADEIKKSKNRKTAAENALARFSFLDGLSDDTAHLSSKERDKLKAVVGGGSFASFDMISLLDNSNTFVQFYVNEAEDSGFLLPYTKRFAVVTQTEKGFAATAKYEQENEIDIAYVSSLASTESAASNVYISYERTEDFRGFDDYVNYLSALLSSSGQEANENGKNAISKYMEYAVNRCSRTMLKTKNNTVSVNSQSVSFIAEFAASSMTRMDAVCASQNVTLNRKARVIPALLCDGLNLTQPIRIEFEPGLSDKLFGASGVRIMLNDTSGVYITTEDLATLESAFDTFCMELTFKADAFSVVFTDKSNAPINYIYAPVWFIVPAKSEYSTVMASFAGGTDNWGGQFDAKNRQIEFSTNYSGDYQIVENDITINDIEDLPADTQKAIRFMVSKGIFTLDKRQRFHPEAVLSRYDFTAALVKMFYSLNVDATTTFTDVPKSSEFYRYIASAEEQGIASGYADLTFRGKKPVSKEQVVTLCGRTLAEKKGYTYPENPESFLVFDDMDTISEWAKADIALAAQCELIENSGSFTPDGTVSRTEGAVMLYKTFMLLYDVSPVTTVSALKAEEPEPSAEPISFLESADFEFRMAMCIIFTVIFVFVFYILVKMKKHRDKKQKE